jgi:uncharacterized membrane protein
MIKNYLKRLNTGHAVFVLCLIVFHIWFLFDVASTASRVEHIMFVLPLVTAACCIGFYILITLHREKASTDLGENHQKVDSRIPLIMIALCAYLLGMVSIGFDLSTFLFLSCSLWLMGERRISVILSFSVALTIFCVFGLREMVSLPVPTFLFSDF